MSRIGKKPIDVPAGVTVTVEGRIVTVKGPRGTLSRSLPPIVAVKVDGAVVNVTRPNDETASKAMHGLRFCGWSERSFSTASTGPSPANSTSATGYRRSTATPWI